MGDPSAQTSARSLGRYELHDAIASGGMATVHVGRLVGPAGFMRTVAIKRLHPHLARDSELLAMFLDEARLAARIHHPNVVPTLDIVPKDDEILLVMEYVHGESLAGLLKAAIARGERIPVAIASAIIVGCLHGLHAAHEARDETGALLNIVHRDVSPHNVLVGIDGIARMIDFGVAKASGRLHTTKDGRLKGKLAYMAPEQYRRDAMTLKIDIYAASIVYWEMLTCERLFKGEDDAGIVEQILFGEPRRLCDVDESLPRELDKLLDRGLARAPDDRFESAREMARAIERSVRIASSAEVADWMRRLAADALATRERLLEGVASAEAMSDVSRVFPQREQVAIPVDVTDTPSATGMTRGAEPEAQSGGPARSNRARKVVVVAVAAAAALGAGVLAVLMVPYSLERHERAEPIAPAASSAAVREESQAPPVAAEVPSESPSAAPIAPASASVQRPRATTRRAPAPRPALPKGLPEGRN